MIKIDLNLFATLSTYLPEDSTSYLVKEGTTVKKLVTNLKVPNDIIKLVFINGKRKDITYQLKNNDRVGIFPPVGGG
ncbi:MoaD/ThiS family protein [Desulfobacterales bacterium HSG17]|nr:MoaD/ThiS family protein [Desulfobacterales bacterium HSG17]